MSPDETDVRLINRHLTVLQRELEELRQASEDIEKLARESLLKELFETLKPTMLELQAIEASGREPDELAQAFTVALPLLGLTARETPGAVLELFPEEANDDFALDRAVSDEASLVRVEIVARGWFRGRKSIVRPRGRVLEVIDVLHDEEE